MQVYIALAPVVDYITGYIMDLESAKKLVSAYSNEFHCEWLAQATSHLSSSWSHPRT